MWTIVFWLGLAAILAGLVPLVIFMLRSYANGTMPGANMFKPRPEPRLQVIEQAAMDGRRKLVLIRRDDVEHLIMTGGPVDVVIETGIGETRLRAAEPHVTAATVLTRPPRTLGSVPGAGE